MRLMKVAVAVMLLANAAASVAFSAPELETFQFWVDEEFTRPAEQVNEKNLTLKLPDLQIAKSIAWVGLLVTDTILKLDSIDRVVETPEVAIIQGKLQQFKVVADKYGDFSVNTLASAREVVVQFDKNRMLFTNMLHRNGSRLEMMKLLRIIAELRARLTVVTDRFDDASKAVPAVTP